MDDAETELVRLMDEMEHNLSELRRLLIELGCDVPARTPWHPSLPGFTPKYPAVVEGDFSDFRVASRNDNGHIEVWLGDGPAA